MAKVRPGVCVETERSDENLVYRCRAPGPSATRFPKRAQASRPTVAGRLPVSIVHSRLQQLGSRCSAPVRLCGILASHAAPRPAP
jgi:hypothetical protein